MTSNTRLADLNLAVDRLDDRRLEVVANGLPLWGGAQLAVDTTLVSPLDSAGRPRPGALVAQRLLKPACGRSAPTPSSSEPTGAASLSSPLRSVAGGARKLRPSSASSLELGRVKCPFPSAPPRLPPSLLAGRRSCPLRLSCPSPSLSSRVASAQAGLALAAQRAPCRLGLPAAPRHPSSVTVLGAPAPP